MKNFSTALNKSDLFMTKYPEEIKDILATLNYSVKTFNAGDLIFGVDQPTTFIGIIIDGSIEVQKNLASGKVVRILYKGQGDIFGEGSVFSKATTYPCNIFAKKKSIIFLVNKENIITLIKSDPILLTNFLSSFANRLLLLNLKTELLSYSSIQQKIAFSLLHMMDEHRHHDTITLPFSKKTWSEHLNVSRPSLFRELKELNYQNTIQIKNNKIIILNEPQLQSILYT